MSYIKNCPDGHQVDADECPYPVDRSKTQYTVHCECPSCPWELIGPRLRVVSAWNDLPEKEHL